MNELFIEKEVFDKIDYSQKKIVKANYENCSFVNCNFASADLSDINFVECEFGNCNLSLANITNATFRDAGFRDSKLLGLHFEKSNQAMFSAHFENDDLSMCSFTGLHLKRTKFVNCILRETDFTGADMRESLFDQCDMTGALFENTNLEKADFRTSYNYAIDPEMNRIRKAKFTLLGIKGLLQKYDIDIQ